MFNNKPNPMTIIDGKEVYLSRSVAVAVAVMIPPLSNFLVVKRGKAVDKSGKYCLPCGYLDYDETTEEAAVRELFEETGYVADPKDLTLFRVDSQPKSNRQNVTLIYTIPYSKVKRDETHVVDFGEVEEVTWLSEVNKDAEFTFDHKDLMADITHGREVYRDKLRFDGAQEAMKQDFEKLAEASGLNDRGKDILFDFLYNGDNLHFKGYIEKSGFQIKDLID